MAASPRSSFFLCRPAPNLHGGSPWRLRRGCRHGVGTSLCDVEGSRRNSLGVGEFACTSQSDVPTWVDEYANRRGRVLSWGNGINRGLFGARVNNNNRNSTAEHWCGYIQK